MLTHGFSCIFETDKVDNMTFQQEPLLVSSPNSAAGVDYRRFVKEYLGGIDNGIELSMMLDLLNDKSAEYWSKMVQDVKYMSIAWRTKERQ